MLGDVGLPLVEVDGTFMAVPVGPGLVEHAQEPGLSGPIHDVEATAAGGAEIDLGSRMTTMGPVERVVAEPQQVGLHQAVGGFLDRLAQDLAILQPKRQLESGATGM